MERVKQLTELIGLLNGLLSDLHYDDDARRNFYHRHGFCYDCYYTLNGCTCSHSDEERATQEEADTTTEEEDHQQEGWGTDKIYYWEEPDVDDVL
jgi:hypothetical protein